MTAHAGQGVYASRTCTVRSGSLRLSVAVAYFTGGSGGPFKCYKLHLGGVGRVCVPTLASVHGSFLSLFKRGLVISDSVTRTVGHKGAALVTFLRAQLANLKLR